MDVFGAQDPNTQNRAVVTLGRLLVSKLPRRRFTQIVSNLRALIIRIEDINNEKQIHFGKKTTT